MKILSFSRLTVPIYKYNWVLSISCVLFSSALHIIAYACIRTFVLDKTTANIDNKHDMKTYNRWLGSTKLFLENLNEQSVEPSGIWTTIPGTNVVIGDMSVEYLNDKEIIRWHWFFNTYLLNPRHPGFICPNMYKKSSSVGLKRSRRHQDEARYWEMIQRSVVEQPQIIYIWQLQPWPSSWQWFQWILI